MPIELRVPSLGESIAEATLGAWLKKAGEQVQLDEPVVEVESEKATVAVPAPASGVLARVLKETGATVAVGEVIALLEEGAGATAAPAAAGGSPVTQSPSAPATSGPGANIGERPGGPAPMPAPAPAAPTPQAAPGAQSPVPGPTAYGGGDGAPAGAPQRGPLRAPPSVRRMIAEHGVDPASLGAGAVVRRADVQRVIEARGVPQPPAGAPAPVAPPGDRERLVPMTPLRRTVARRLLEAQQAAAILTTFNEVDMAKVLALREKHADAFVEKHGVKLGFTSFFVKAAVEALRAFPVVNAEIRGDAIVYKDHYDVGVAVGGGKGLVVPVLRDADRLTFAEIEKTTAALAKKARENRITMQDLEGGTFTISNGGVYGSLLSTPILNPPQSAILGLHKIEKRPIALADDSVAVRPMMYVALSYDHRLIDGREAVSFLVRLKECVEDPERLMLEI
jgi:2-oxoglutarate dehydrogenase E2 component (dihydrolipoamide succinyltransferase)